MRSRATAARRGMTLVELLVAMVVLGIFGTASVRLLLSQTTFYDKQLKQREARTVSRAAVNMMLSELRMVERTGGVEGATASSVTLRVPYVMGILCGTAAGISVVALVPTDSTVIANATPSGHAWRDANGAYTYTNATVATVAGGSGVCTFNNISPDPKGRVISMTPPVPAGANPGDAVFLYQRIKYEFAGSNVLSGRRALWRVVVDSDAHEELAAPFESSARFRYFQFGRDTSDLAANVADVEGIEMVFNGASQSARPGGSSAESSPFRTSVFFNNRVN